MSVSVFAQEKNITDSVFSIKEVEVLGSRSRQVELLNMDVPLKYIPLTVTKLNGEALERKNILNLDDAVRFLPGVTVTDQLGAFQRFSIRGTSDAVVAVNGVRDERSLMNNVPFGDLSSVESIEVIKGPASILSGHSVMGGVINIIQKKPTETFTANARITYGSWNIKQSTVGFGGKIYGPVNYRAHLHYSTGDGYRHVGADRFSGMLVLGAHISKTGYLEANVSFNDDRYRTEIGSAPIMPGDIYRTSDNGLLAKNADPNPFADYHTIYNDLANNKMRRRNIDLSMQYTQPLTEWMKLRERFTYGHSDLDYTAIEGMKYRTSTKPIYKWYYLNKDGKTKQYIELDSLQSGDPLCFNPDSKGYTNTLELTGRIRIGAIGQNYTLGWNHSFFDYTQYNGYEKGDVWGPGVKQMLSVKDPYLVRNWWDSKVSAVSIRQYVTNGIYLHDVIDINEQWKGMIGGRLDLYKYRSASAKTPDGRQHYNEEDRSEWKKVSTQAFSYRAGIVYLPASSVSLYLSASSYFKPQVRFYDPKAIYYDRNWNRFEPNAEGGQVFRPEKGNQAELGIRYTLNDMLEANASVFYIRKYNVVREGEETVIENGASVTKRTYAQVGRAASKGFDLDITFRPIPTLQIVAGWGWSDYRLLSSNIDYEKWPKYSEIVNLRATGIPRTTCFAYADYLISKGILKDMSFHLSATYTDRIYRNVRENLYYPSVFLIDAGIYYTIKKQVTLSFLVNNIFDKEYFVKRTVLGKPRNFMVSASYRFQAK